MLNAEMRMKSGAEWHVGSGSKPDYPVAGHMSASAECRHGSRVRLPPPGADHA
jgi:hypothetical protein